MKKTTNVQAQRDGASEKTEKQILTKTIILTALKTLMLGVFVLAFVLVSMSAIAPKLAIKVYGALGANDAVYMVYERDYARKRTNESLYNVLQQSISRKDYLKVEKYAKLMISGDDFKKFANKVDEASKKTLAEKYNIYSDSYEVYVRNNLLIALYKNGKNDEAKMMAINSVYQNAEELYVYVQIVLADEKLTDLQRQTELRTLHTRYGIKDELARRLAQIDPEIDTDPSQKIAALTQKLKIVELQYVLADASGDETVKAEAKAEREKIENELTTVLGEL